MINKVAQGIAKILSGPASNSKKHQSYSQNQIEQIITSSIIASLRFIRWSLLLLILSNIIFFFGIDIRLSTLIVFLNTMIFRNRFGGYHADSEKACMIISTIIPLILGYIVIILDFNIYFIITIYLFAYYTAARKGVVDHPNRRFEEGNEILNLNMKSRLFKTGIALLIIINIINLYFFFTGCMTISDSILLGTLISFVSLYFGK